MSIHIPRKLVGSGDRDLKVELLVQGISHLLANSTLTCTGRADQGGVHVVSNDSHNLREEIVSSDDNLRIERSIVDLNRDVLETVVALHLIVDHVDDFTNRRRINRLTKES